ncbi:GntR family transcriptional regulator [Novosphingobium resinovorum]|jgi:DNA-binding GntR family transcriptional regulator|uniref:GntR family transcriptional regulator n=1 Tax=Novosphingobium TaxID=165696 RepID=UPI001B3C5E5F|nr:MULTISPECIES: GntR family transcriptional regulator [Novosphingobium]MBF7013300.1 GntR family transcriptional regulator [Novosphingobium sp. HR1a]WJM25451.1 GntR family transcriptional regulator [Novosphingobium resinovorum]
MKQEAPAQTGTLLNSADSEVYTTVLARIKSGAIEPEERIVDSKLAAEFNLSRMPVRQALLRLVHEGYLVGTTRGFVLPRLTYEDIEEIFEVRMLLEPRAAASACRTLAPEALAALREALAEARRAVAEVRLGNMMIANDRFRQIWLDAVPNRRLATSISRFVDHVQIVRRATIFDAATQHVVLDLLTRMLDGFDRKDALLVQDATLQFVVRAREAFIAATSIESTQGRAFMG